MILSEYLNDFNKVTMSVNICMITVRFCGEAKCSTTATNKSYLHIKILTYSFLNGFNLKKITVSFWKVDGMQHAVWFEALI